MEYAMSPLDLSNTLYFFPLASSIIIIMTFVHIHTPTSLLPKNYSKKKTKSKMKKVLKSNAF
jgi:hypothetical protein